MKTPIYTNTISKAQASNLKARTMQALAVRMANNQPELPEFPNGSFWPDGFENEKKGK